MSEQLKSSADTYQLLHVRNTQFTSNVATGVIATGPTDDGFLHLHFFREMQRIHNEEVPVRASDNDGMVLDRNQASIQVRLLREEVATISIPATAFEHIVNGLAAVAKEVLSKTHA